MVRFNVTLIQPPAYVHAAALAEAADYVFVSLRECGFVADRTTNSIVDDAVNIVFCSHILGPDAAGQIPSDAIIFNSEKLVGDIDWPNRNPAYKALLHTHYVWDYSVNNLACLPHDNKACIHFGYTEALRRPDIVRKPNVDLLFYGAITPWRHGLLQDLQRRGISVRVLFGAYGDARDREMMSAWAILNLHKDRSKSIFEPIRCFYPLTNGVPVISESADDPTAQFFLDSVIFLEADELANKIIQFRKEHERFLHTASACLQNFRTKSGHETVRTAVERYLTARAQPP